MSRSWQGLASFSSGKGLRDIPSSHFKAFDEFLDFPDSNVFIGDGLCAHGWVFLRANMRRNFLYVDRQARSSHEESAKISRGDCPFFAGLGADRFSQLHTSQCTKRRLL